MSWPEILKSAKKIAYVENGRRCIHYKFSDNEEMIEEYDLNKCLLLARRWQRNTITGGKGKWETEVGEYSTNKLDIDVTGLSENSNNPIFTRKDTPTLFQWRIRNLSYPISNYDVKVNDEKTLIVVKTQNKKYYKTFQLPDLNRMKITLDSSQLSFEHKCNTLIISYKKPQVIVDLEKVIYEELLKMQNTKTPKPECNPS